MPDAAQMARLGLTLADYESDVFELWPENLPAVQLYGKCGTQWRQGPNGPTGLDHGMAFHWMGRMSLSDEAYDDLFSDLQVMEAEVLAIHREQREEEARTRK